MRQVQNLKAVAKLVLSASFLFGAIQVASAADILVPAPIPAGMPTSEEDIFVPAPVPIPQTMRYYLRGDIGASISDPGESHFAADVNATSDTDLSNTTVIGIGAGAYFSPRFRGDITVDYRTKSDLNTGISGFFNGSQATGNEFDSIDLNTALILVNGYYDFRREGSRFTPYVGAGIGVAIHTLKNRPGYPFIGTTNNQDTQFAAAAMAGVAVDLRKGWKLDAHYRYLYMGDASMNTLVEDPLGNTWIDGDLKVEDITAHEVRVGMRYEIY